MNIFHTRTRTIRNRGLRRRGAAGLAVLALGIGSLSACSAATSATSATSVEGTVWDASSVHEVSIDVDEDEFDAMLATYQESDEKEWLTADVTIDGQTITDAGIRLKGNSSLRDVDADADPGDLPWLIDLDKFVDGQSLDGWERFVIRSNTTETSLNEAVALALLEEAGLASEEAVSISFSANDSGSTLRLMVQDLDDRWDEAAFGTDGTLYKAEAGGDYSYRGDDPEAYDEVFDIEAGTDDHEPLTDFLQWLEESSVEELAEGLADRLDVEAYATYLAFEDLVGNFDDIAGPGNNSFLRWDAEAEQMTVVAWDHNLAFGATNGGGQGGAAGGEPGGGGAPGERPEPPEGMEPPVEGELPEAGGVPGGGGQGGMGGNVLAERFLATAEFADLYDAAVEDLQADLFDSGTAQDVLDAWTSVLGEQADDLVDAATIELEAEQVASYFDGHAVAEGADGTDGTDGAAAGG
jgi:spore coat protein CotH